MTNKFASTADLIRKVYFLARPYSRRKPLIVFAIILFQGMMQVVGVTSIFPFLAVASDPAAFRSSRFGELILGVLPVMSDRTMLITAGCGSIALLVLANVTNLASDYARARYAHGLGHWLRVRLLREITSQPWSYFLQQNTAVLLKKASGDVMQMINQVLLPTLEAISRFATVFFLVLAILFVEPGIAIVAGFVLLVFYSVVFKLLQTRRTMASAGLKASMRGNMREAQQLLSGIKIVKVSGATEYFLSRFSRYSQSLAHISARLPIYLHAPKYLLEPLAFGGMIGVVVVYISLGRAITDIIPTLGVIGLAGYRLIPSAQLLYMQLSQVSANRFTVEEVYDEFRQAVENGQQSIKPCRADSDSNVDWDQEIRLVNLCFQYPETKDYVLKDVNITIPARSSLGIVGATGSGKSTLVDLILGLHTPTEGTIFADCTELGERNLRDWQALIGYVPQDIFLMDDTITRNIAFGVPDDEIDLQRVAEASAASRIFKFIDTKLPERFDTVVGERGVRLSGGQRQRIALARALYRKPKLLILDEATSALDTNTEAEVMKAIHALQGEVTMIMVAHRLTTIERCDQILDLTASVTNPSTLIS